MNCLNDQKCVEIILLLPGVTIFRLFYAVRLSEMPWHQRNLVPIFNKINRSLTAIQLEQASSSDSNLDEF